MKSKLIFYILILDSFFFTGLLFYFDVKWYFAVLPLLVLFIIISIASFNIQLNFFLKSIHNGNPDGNKTALTFDDGPHPVYTSQVLDILKKFNAKATFFLIGQNVKQYPYLVKRIVDEGHTIGSHSFTHSKTIDFKHTKGWLRELEETDLEILKITGKKVHFFRPPFGVTTPHLASALKKTEHLSIGWNQRTYDTVLNDVGKINRKIIKNARPGDIILLHDRHENIITLLEQLLPELARKNFTFVTVNELIDEKPYTEI